MKDSISNRVAKSISNYPLSNEELAKRLNVSYATINRWSKGEKKRFKDSELNSLSKVLRVEKEWLLYGEDEAINHISRRVADAGDIYKGPGQTLLNVELKAKSLIRELRSLVDEIQNLKKND